MVGNFSATHANILLLAVLLDLDEFDLLQTNELLQLALLAVNLLLAVCKQRTRHTALDDPALEQCECSVFTYGLSGR